MSGFNVEFGGAGFAFIFMAEYGMIIFISYLIVVLFLGGVCWGLLLGGSILFI